MALSNYDELKAAIADYLGRDDLDERMADIVRLAEIRLNREMRMRCMEHRASAYVAAGTDHISLPWKRVDGDWDVFLEMRDLVWKGSGTVRNLRYTAPDTYSAEQMTRSGMPTHYTIIGHDLYLMPVPDADGDVFLTYYAEIPPLSAVQTMNDVLMLAPDLYLYAALIEAAAWTRGSVPAELWNQYYQEARSKWNEAEQFARFTSNLSMKPQRRV